MELRRSQVFRRIYEAIRHWESTLLLFASPVIMTGSYAECADRNPNGRLPPTLDAMITETFTQRILRRVPHTEEAEIAAAARRNQSFADLI